MKYDAQKNYDVKKRNLELFRRVDALESTPATRKLLAQVEDDFKFAEYMLKKEKGEVD